MSKEDGTHFSVLKSTDEAITWNDQPDILTGIAGAGLCILSAISPSYPAWDEIFLLDIN